MTFHRLCGLDDLTPCEALRFDVAGHRIALARLTGEEFYAIGDRCSHADYSLSDGILDEWDCTLECPKHGSLFDLRTGQPLTLPATRPVAAYALAVKADGVYVELPSAPPAAGSPGGQAGPGQAGPGE